jgi:hypothetical protein
MILFHAIAESRRLPSKWIARRPLARVLLAVLTGSLGQTLQAQELTQLKLYWNGSRQDNVLAAAGGASESDHLNTNYRFIRAEPGYVFRAPQPNTVPLNLYWSDERQDNVLAVADGVSARDHLNTRYRFIRTEGYVYSQPVPGTIPLKLYWNAARRDNTLIVEGSASEADMRATSYFFVRVDGYVLRNPPSAAPAKQLPQTSLRVNHTGKCVDVEGGDIRSGARIVQNECSGNSRSQLWVERYVDGPWAMLVNGKSGMCIELEGSSPAARLVQRPCSADQKQQWFHTRPENEGDKFAIVARMTEMCAGVEGGALHGGAGLLQWQCQGADNQRFSRIANAVQPEKTAKDALSIIAQDVLGIQDPDPEICWKNTNTRGVGTLANTCPASHPDHDGALLCYEKCRPGYSATTITTCGTTCPAGWGNEPATCRKPNSYNTTGYALYFWEFWKSTSTMHAEAKARCERGEGTTCEWRAALYYPKCRANFSPEPLAAWVCAPRCPAGMTDTGFGSCWKQSYFRGSIPTQCPAGKQRDAHDPLGLCYTPCPSNTTAVGPVCWAGCTGAYGTGCGAACAKSVSACVFSIVEQVQSTAEMVLNVSSLIATAGAATPMIQAGKVAAKTAGKRTLSAAQKQAMQREIVDHLEKAAEKLKPSKRDVVVSGVQDGANDFTGVANMLVTAYEDGEFDWHSLVPTAADLDPTGFLSVIRAFNKPVCR